jgi:hypothetical protein
VDALFSPSVDTGFLARRSDPNSARGEWTHVVGMLTREEPSVVAISGNDSIGEMAPAPDGAQAAMAAGSGR